jgi:hypothetical protein
VPFRELPRALRAPASTLFPDAAIGWPAIIASVAGAALPGALAGLRLGDDTARRGDAWPDRSTWTMPRIGSLPPPVPSRARTVGLVVLRAYLLLAAAAVIAKLIGLIGHA